MQLWRRLASISFGVRGSLGPKITGNRIVFSLGKTSDSSANTSRIQVYNLSNKSRTILESETELAAILEAGYLGTGLSQIFTGDIDRSSHTKRGPDWITTLFVKDGHNALTNVSVTKSYAAGFDSKAIIKEIADKMKAQAGIVIKNLDNIASDIMQNGFAADGQAKDIIDDITGKLGLDWMIQDNELIIKEPDSDIGESIVYLSEKTGLIGSPVRREKGIEFRSLLQPKIKSGGLVNLQSENLNGLYQVKKLQSKGDTHGNSWYTQATAVIKND